jgi:benzaldehyde dehydrogenase (NAD)
VVEALISHPAVKRNNFTGSTRVGKLLAVQAAQHLKPILLELGGKAPLLVLDDADLDAAVDATVFGAYANQGQICMSTERVIAHESVADAFATKLAARVKALPVGDPRTGEFVLASVVGQGTVDRINRLLLDATTKGAKIIAGGTATSTIMPGIVVDHVTPEMDLWREETFAPQVSITRVMSDDEAVAMANDTEYGLSAAVFTRDISRGLAVARRIESGICHINSPTVQDEAQMPFGGVKGSGYGRFGGKAGVAEFTELRWISIQTTPRRYPF